MAVDPPGWYWDPKRPGIKRYWDGHAWVDVDSLAADRPSTQVPDAGGQLTGPRPPDALDETTVVEAIVETGPRLIRQRTDSDPRREE